MINDLQKNYTSSKLFDYCIIGSGPAGISLALKLAKKKKSIFLAEAGDIDWSRASTECYQGETIGDDYFALDTSRLRMFGGTSGHWTGMCRTLDKEDFNYSNSKWPIGKKDLDPFLDEACEILEIDSEFNDQVISRDYGIKSIDFHFSPPVRFGKKYFEQIQRSKFIHLSLNTNLVNMLFNEENINTAEFKSYNGNHLGVRARCFILACGGIENSRLLKWINFSNNKKLINSKSPLGNYWMEHPHYKVGQAVVDRRWSDRYINISASKRIELGILNAGIRFEHLGDTQADAVIKDLMCVAPNLGKNIAKLFDKNLVCAGTLRAAWEQEPIFNNRVELSKNKKDIFGIPKSKLFWKKTDNDFKTLQITMRHINKWIMNTNLGRLKLDKWLLDKEDYPALDELGGKGYHHIGGYHHMGGTRMGTNPERGVVDKNLKLFGKSNLFICGSSVFPSAGHANPTLTLTQLSLRLASFLARKY